MTPIATRTTASIVALALSALPIAACAPCENAVEADTGIPSDRPVKLRVSWCDGGVCIRGTLSDDAPRSAPPGDFLLSDRNGHWFVELLDPSKRTEFAPATLEIREAESGALVIRADSNHQSDDGCVFMSVTGPPRP